MLISELLEGLLGLFPADTAEPWDHVGLSVGRPDDEVRGVTVALDASEANVRRAAADGSNVLLTHHPVYIKTPQAFVPASPAYPSSAAAVFSAVECGVSIISLHTNLDRSLEVRELLPSLVDLTAATSSSALPTQRHSGWVRLRTLLLISPWSSLRPVAAWHLVAVRACGEIQIGLLGALLFWAAPWAISAGSP